LVSILPKTLTIAGMAEENKYRSAIVVLARTFTKEAALKIENALIRVFMGLIHNRVSAHGQASTELNDDQLVVANFLIERFLWRNVGKHLTESQCNLISAKLHWNSTSPSNVIRR